MTDLSTEEVIMNSFVKSETESDFPRMHLTVVESGNNHMESPYHFPPTISSPLTIAFINPYTKDEFNDDIQFVMEVEGLAEFVSGGALGCENNKRVSSRLIQGGKVELQINDPSKPLRVWAGWACGHQAVRLTPSLLLEPAATAAAAKIPEKDQDEGERKGKKSLSRSDDAKERMHRPVKGHVKNAPEELEEVKEPDKKMKDDRKSHHQKDKPLKPDRPDKPREKGHVGQKREKIKIDTVDTLLVSEEMRKLIQGDEATGTQKDAEDTGDYFSGDEQLDPLKDRSNLAEQHKQHLEKHDKIARNYFRHYDSDEFAGGLHTTRHLFACIFVIVSFGSVFLALKGRRDNKGRRDL
jgi:hypothetical protein